MSSPGGIGISAAGTQARSQPGAPAAARGTRTVGHLGGIPVRVHASALPIAGLVAYALYRALESHLPGAGGLTVLAATVAGTLLLLASVLAHELGHALASLGRGVPVSGITLFLLGEGTESHPRPIRARDELAIAGAGPFVNVVLAGLFGLITVAAVPLPPAARLVAADLAWANLGVTAFNALPAYPLDGGRMLRTMLWALTGRRDRATRWAARAGQWFALALALVGLSRLPALADGGGVDGLWSLVLPLSLALCLFCGATAARRRARADEGAVPDAVRDQIAPPEGATGARSATPIPEGSRGLVPLLQLAWLLSSTALLAAAAALVPLPWFVEFPGGAMGLARVVEVVDAPVEPVDGDFLYTTVLLDQATLVEVVRGLATPELSLVYLGDVIPPGQSQAAYFAHQQAVFATSAQVASAVALRAAGYEVGPDSFGGQGALVAAVLPGSAASGVLRPGDLIVQADGRAVHTDEDLRAAVERGGRMPITVRRDGRTLTLQVAPEPRRDERSVLGIQVRTRNPTIDLPVEVRVPAQGVGGPSAGLMIALTVFDQLDPADVAAGRRIAGTGTLRLDGRVGAISGIRQKVLAAHRQDVDVFLAPASQLAEARSSLPRGSDLRVIGVDTFQDALTALRR